MKKSARGYFQTDRVFRISTSMVKAGFVFDPKKPRMIKVAVALYGVNALFSILTGARYFRRTDFLPYQAKVAGRGVADLDPGLRSVVLAMLEVIGGGFIAIGAASLGLCIALWQGSTAANWALLIATALFLGPAWIAASGLNRVGPNIGAPTRLVVVAASIAAVAFVAALMG